MESYIFVIQIREDHLFPCMTAHFKNPLLIEKGDMQYLYDHKGQKYLDLFARVENIAYIYKCLQNIVGFQK